MTDILTDNFTPKTPPTFYCKSCDFKCCKPSDFNRHLNTLKHTKLINTDDGDAKKRHICQCGKSYKHPQSLYNHKKKCTGIKETVDEGTNYKELMLGIMNENKELRKMMLEIIPQIGNTNIKQNFNNNVKQNFNINVFLNEKCKDALTIDEFIEKIEISMKNLLTTKDKGLGEGLSNIVIENMNKLSLYERPIHCTDKKRETIYIKNDEWEKDESKEKINKFLKKVEHKQLKNIEQWTNKYPNYMDNSKLQEEYIGLVKSCTSSIDSCKGKVIRKLCDNVYLTEKE